MEKIRSRASFASSRDRESVLRVYREGIRILSRRLADRRGDFQSPGGKGGF